MRLGPALVAVLAALAAARAAAAGPPPAVEGGLETEARRVTVGSLLHLTYLVEMPQADHVQWMSAREGLGGFEIRAARPPARTRLDGGRVRESLELDVATFDVGVTVLPGPVVRVTGQDSLSLHLPSAGILVQTVLGARDKNRDIRDIKGPAGWRRPLPKWAKVAGLSVAALAVLGLLLWLGLWWARRRRDAELRLPPHVRALRDLEQLRTSDLLANRRFKDFHVRLTEILRRYLGEIASFNALDLTTGEVLAEAAQRLPGEMEAIRRILEASDLVKFAKVVPGPGASEELLGDAAQLVERTRPKEEAA